MQRCKIQYLNNGDFYSSVSISYSKKKHRSIILPKKVAEKLKVGDTIRIVQDNKLCIEDYVYLYRGGMTFHTKPASYDEHSCKCYIENVPGLFSDGKFDRAIFKIALMRECQRHKLGVSTAAWRNLRNLFLWDAYSPLMR